MYLYHLDILETYIKRH